MSLTKQRALNGTKNMTKVVDGQLYRWVGIGWVNEGKVKKDGVPKEPKLITEKKPKKKKKAVLTNSARDEVWFPTTFYMIEYSGSTLYTDSKSLSKKVTDLLNKK